MNFKCPCLTTAIQRNYHFLKKKINISLNASGTLADNVNIQYLHNIICREALHQFDIFCVQVVNMNMAYFNQVILCFGTYFPTVNALSKKNRDAPQNEEDTYVKIKKIH